MNRQWSVVSGQWPESFARLLSFLFHFHGSDGLQAGIKTWGEFIYERFNPVDLRFSDQLAAQRASEKMLCFFEPPARRSDETSVVLITAASCPLRDVHPHSVSR